MTPIQQALENRLSLLDPEKIEVIDESHLHAGHRGAKEGGHYKITIVAKAFIGKSTMTRHRLVYNAIGDLMRQGIHALSIKALAPGES